MALLPWFLSPLRAIPPCLPMLAGRHRTGHAPELLFPRGQGAVLLSSPTQLGWQTGHHMATLKHRSFPLQKARARSKGSTCSCGVSLDPSAKGEQIPLDFHSSLLSQPEVSTSKGRKLIPSSWQCF